MVLILVLLVMSSGLSAVSQPVLNALCLNAALVGDLSDVQKYLYQGASVKSVTGDNESLLMQAVLGRNPKVVEYLLGHKVPMEITSKIAGATPLLASIDTEQPDIAKMIVDAGADVNAANNTGFSPLMSAVELGNVDLVNYLLGKGALISQQDSCGKTAAHSAIQKDNVEILGAILAAKNRLGSPPENDLLADALLLGRLKHAMLLLKHGADITVQDKSGNQPLVMLMRHEDDMYAQKCAKLLLFLGADPSAQNNQKKTAVDFCTSGAMKAILQGNYSVSAAEKKFFENIKNARVAAMGTTKI